MNARNDTPVDQENIPQSSLRGSQTSLSKFEWVAWGIALIFTLGDLSITLVAIQSPAISEAVPISKAALEIGGPLGLLVKDAILTLGLFCLFLFIPQRYRQGVPLGVAAARGWLVLVNLSVVGLL